MNQDNGANMDEYLSHGGSITVSDALPNPGIDYGIT
jgi:hypothetical protein